MEHLSRFRRTRKASPAGPAGIQETSLGRQIASPSRQAPPVLSISTAISTTPPSSSHSASSASSLHPPKSPFRSLQHLRSAHKRARSPAPASVAAPIASTVVNHDGTAEHEMMSPAMGESNNGNMLPIGKPGEKPEKPSFLALTEREIESKFEEVSLQEQDRVLRAAENASPNHQFARLPLSETKHLDRYMNIFPWANNRVKLQVPSGTSDYVNASPIILRSPLRPDERPPLRYIAMQGPKAITTGHVWRMITEQLKSPAVIVMLTDVYEGGSEKCFPYFPRDVDDGPIEIGEEEKFGDGFRAQVTCESVEERAEGAIQMRKINIHVEGREEDMTVWHLLYRKWPDFGVPALQDIDSFFELMRLSREKNASEDNPRIIHCSAGVGRSGTFIALEHLMREVDSGDLEHYDQLNPSGTNEDLVFATVNALREQRKQMVQADSQYLFIYQVLRKQWMEKYGIPDDCSGDEPAAKRLELDRDPFIED
ncbi:phosphatases II [Biscogniauxia marginata]|nr:phosphatases II [Biscogniauxia marginata]